MSMDQDSGRPGGLSSQATEPASAVSAVPASIPDAGLPPSLLAQLTCLPEEAPADFTCAICELPVSNRYHWSPRDYERPPVCMTCESVSGSAWHGAVRCRTMPKGGTYRDRREALRIGALADAIAAEAHQQTWRAKYGRA